MPGVGIYHKWSVTWGYTVLPNAEPVDDERETLNACVERAGDPLYFYGSQRPRADPLLQKEDLCVVPSRQVITELQTSR